MIHHGGCTLGRHQPGTTCRNASMDILGKPEDCKEGCTLGEHNGGLACFPAIIPGRPPRPIPDIKTTRLDVDIPAGPQPVEPGPLHAVLRGPGGLDITISAGERVFGRVLEAVGAVFANGMDD